MAERRIVMLRSHEWLAAGFEARSMSATRGELDARMRIPSGVEVKEELFPVRVPLGAVVTTADTYTGEEGDGYLVAAEFDDEEAMEAFDRDNEDVVGVFRDPEIGLCPSVNPTSAVGTTSDVETALQLSTLQAAGGTGRGVKIVVVDNGIDGTMINVAGGFSPRPGVSPGTAAPDHGTMVAFDSLIAAPDAIVFDYPLLQSTGGLWVGFLSDAIRAFSEILVQHLQTPGPMIAVNSWAMYDRAQDAPVGDPQNYSRNPNHPFNQMVSALAGSGVDVVFAAGNCGMPCPDGRCGVGDAGPGNSIHGANSHLEAVSVAAVTVNDDRLCYSSQGPGALNPQAPDISGFSHFSGSGIFAADSGTSAACPVVAGVMAALRSTPQGRALTPAVLKGHLLRSARSVHGSGWSPDFGWGIVDGDAAFAAIP